MYRISYFSNFHGKLVHLEDVATWYEACDLLKVWACDGHAMTVQAIPHTVEDRASEPSLESDSWITLGEAARGVLASLVPRIN